MSEQKQGGHCRICKKNVVIFRKGPNHILHLLLAIVTAGIWIPVWLLLSITEGNWRCSVCGSNKVRTESGRKLDTWLDQQAHKTRQKRRDAIAAKKQSGQ
jgi:hypothetical protein